ncbi:MAG: alpha/beta hydrolase [Exiguobacterium profundum]|nr:MAG: alpha/beta hydrolase [Exiguobacterium profundum]
MRIIETGGLRLATEGFGKPGDPAVVLVMGATASMLGWPEAFCTGLAAQGRRVIRFDHRDTGASTTLAPGAAGYAVEDMATDVQAVMDGHGIGRAAVMGMSLGGYIGQMVALMAPERVSALILLASEPLGWDGPELPHMSAAVLAHFGDLAGLDWTDAAAVAEFMVETERLCAGSVPGFDADAARARVAAVQARTDSPASMFNHASLTLREDWTGRFRQIALPVLVIHGAEDPVLPAANGEALAAGIAGAEVMIVPGMGHDLVAPHVDQIAERVGAFLKRRTR